MVNYDPNSGIFTVELHQGFLRAKFQSADNHLLLPIYWGRQKLMSKRFPIFIENSRIPVWLSYISPITIAAITLGPLVFSSGIMSEKTKNHEAIHWEQYKECFIFGFLILYFIFWFVGLLRYKSGSIAYQMILFEQEAYDNQHNASYPKERKRYSWVKYYAGFRRGKDNSS